MRLEDDRIPSTFIYDPTGQNEDVIRKAHSNSAVPEILKAKW